MVADDFESMLKTASERCAALGDVQTALLRVKRVRFTYIGNAAVPPHSEARLPAGFSSVGLGWIGWLVGGSSVSRRLN